MPGKDRKNGLDESQTKPVDNSKALAADSGLAASGRGGERNKRAVLTAISSTIARVIQAVSTLITVPLTLRYLGNERFGLWMAINSVLLMATFADFGLGNGILNTVATAYGKDDFEGIRKAISSGIVALTTVATLMFVIYLTIYPHISWGDFFHVTSSQARSEAGPTFTVFILCFLLNIPLDIVQRVQLGMQQGYINGLWQMCGSLVALAGVLLGIHFGVSLPVLVAAVAGGPVLSMLLNSIHFLIFNPYRIRPHYRYFSRDTITHIARLGTLFFILQLSASIAFSADNFVIARTLGAVHVPEYSIPQRLFGFISMISAILINPLWPAYGEAISRNDTHWIKTTLQKSLFGVLAGASVAAVGLLIAIPTILHIWVGNRVHPSFILILGLAIWVILECCGNAVAIFLNGVSIIRFQVATSVVFSAACLITKFIVARRYGISAVPWATISTYVLCVAIPYLFYLPRVITRLGTHPSQPQPQMEP